MTDALLQSCVGRARRMPAAQPRQRGRRAQRSGVRPARRRGRPTGPRCSAGSSRLTSGR
jgi:hypothetical protein